MWVSQVLFRYVSGNHVTFDERIPFVVSTLVLDHAHSFHAFAAALSLVSLYERENGYWTDTRRGWRHYFVTITNNNIQEDDMNIAIIWTLLMNIASFLLPYYWPSTEGQPHVPSSNTRSFFILNMLNVLIPESTLLFTRTKTEQICLRYPQPIAPFIHVLKKRFDHWYLLAQHDVFLLITMT